MSSSAPSGEMDWEASEKPGQYQDGGNAFVIPRKQPKWSKQCKRSADGFSRSSNEHRHGQRFRNFSHRSADSLKNVINAKEGVDVSENPFGGDCANVGRAGPLGSREMTRLPGKGRPPPVSAHTQHTVMRTPHADSPKHRN